MNTRSDRACMLCGIVQPQREFIIQGCPNCESIINFKSDDGLVQDCTSPTFEGLVALTNNQKSWVAKWLRIDGFENGLYATKVGGKLPPDIVSDLEEKGITYRPRDGSATE